jgi:hypothetical protein
MRGATGRRTAKSAMLPYWVYRRSTAPSGRSRPL